MSEGKKALVREEQVFEASGVPVVLQGMLGSYAFLDKC